MDSKTTPPQGPPADDRRRLEGDGRFRRGPPRPGAVREIIEKKRGMDGESRRPHRCDSAVRFGGAIRSFDRKRAPPVQLMRQRTGGRRRP